MKKTLTINISGTVFHIEEDAFDKLQDYLLSLKHHFENQSGGNEILQDIETRIAELLQEKMAGVQEVVTQEWVDEVIDRMGQPADFGDQEEETEKTTTKTEKTKKRLYRDGESRVLGGVCSGLSAYFDIDPVILRILFVALIFLGVGISAFLYLILWVVVPKASTTAQRLEMRGEDATITNIQKSVQEEVTEVKKSFSKMNDSEAVKRGKNLAGKAVTSMATGVGRLLAVVLGVFFMFIGFLGFVAFMVSVILGGTVFNSTVSGVNADVDLSGFLGFVVNPGIVNVSILLAVLLVGIPLLAILFLGTKLVFRYKTNNRMIGLGAFGIWLVALLIMISITAGQVSNFSQQNSTSLAKPLTELKCKTLTVEIGSTPENVSYDEDVHLEDFTIVKQNNENVLAGSPTIRIEPTTAADFSVVVSKKSRGKNAADLQNNLKNIQYDFTGKDSTLLLNRYFTLGNGSKWRKQEVVVTLKVPAGKQVHLNNNLDQVNLDAVNVNNLWSKEMVGKTWTMTPEGLTIKEQ